MNGDQRSPESRGGNSFGERDRAEASRFITYCREICQRRGKHVLEHGQYWPHLKRYVARCHICDFVQAIERGGDDNSPMGRAVKSISRNGLPAGAKIYVADDDGSHTGK